MTAATARVVDDPLKSWVETAGTLRRPRAKLSGRPSRARLRFALYGRMSTVEYQDASTSAGWQRQIAADLIAGRGVIVAEFFDVGVSRRVPWLERPRAAALLAAVQDPGRGFDAVVVGEYERAFQDDQFFTVISTLGRCGVRLWLPEASGPVDLDDPAHRALMLVLGSVSRREVLRSRHRVLTAMCAQVRTQGRYLGGRPPYGYRLVDAGPHPNPAHASWGRRAHRLAPDPATAPHVRWMFAQRLAGRSKAGIARELNDRGVPCPSAVDRRRNRHRGGEAWTLRSVAAILANPRYTGRQVWNRHGSDHDTSLDGAGRWNPPRDWVISKAVAHPPLVSEGDFVAAQAVRAARPTGDGGKRTYLFTGLVLCGVCERRMDAHWLHGRPGYRCRHGARSSRLRAPRPGNVYIREDRLLRSLAEQYAGRSDAEVVAELRASNRRIVCTATGWSLTEPPSAARARPPDGALF